mgnify:FL=1|tara:strand:- start:270 stop:638 length:369 start_codon:yes stop_codon:yes gene_type:complete
MAAINLDTAARLDITCRKGDTFQLEIDFEQTVPTSTWLMHVRETDTSEEDENIIIPEDDITFAVADNSSGVTNALLTVTIADSVMAEVQSGTYVYDIQNDSVNVTKTYVFGLFKVNEDVTTP